MVEQYGLTVGNLLRTLPVVLQNDTGMAALAAVIAETLSDRMDETESPRIYARIDQLPEELLDILAYDFKVDWWDANYTLEEKRQTLKDSWRVHRMLGTKAAVETAISAVYPGTQVKEWFEYDGEPYHFRLLIDATFESIDRDKHQRVLDRVAYYKNLRSVLDDIEYYDAGGIAAQYVGTAYLGCDITDSAIAVQY